SVRTWATGRRRKFLPGLASPPTPNTTLPQLLFSSLLPTRHQLVPTCPLNPDLSAAEAAGRFAALDPPSMCRVAAYRQPPIATFVGSGGGQIAEETGQQWTPLI